MDSETPRNAAKLGIGRGIDHDTPDTTRTSICAGSVSQSWFRAGFWRLPTVSDSFAESNCSRGGTKNSQNTAIRSEFHLPDHQLETTISIVVLESANIIIFSLSHVIL